jgi:hypothetical protein
MATKKTSTALATKANTNIVDIKAQLAAQVAALAERTAPPTGAKVTVTQSKKFKFPDGTETPGPFEAVIVDYNVHRKFYSGTYDPNNIVPPECFAISDKPKGMTPSDNSPVKQDGGKGCDLCPQNQWGSARTGGGKACKETRKLAILPPAEDGENVNETPLWTLETSPTALKPFDAYVNGVAKTFQVPPVGVVTQFSFDANSDYPSVRFEHPQPNPALAEHFARQGEAQDILKTEPDVSAYGQEAPKPAARGRAPAGRATPPRR